MIPSDGSADQSRDSRTMNAPAVQNSPMLHLTPTGFPHVLYNILNTEDPSIIKWTSSGQAFGIQNMVSFRMQVLPRHFKHDKFSSFQRQLNLYGFRKIVRGREAGGYMHKDFQRGRLDLLKNVRRGVMPPCPEQYAKKIYGTGGKGENSGDSDPELTPPPRGAMTAASYSPPNIASIVNKNDPGVKEEENLILDRAAEQLRRLSSSAMDMKNITPLTSHMKGNGYIGQNMNNYHMNHNVKPEPTSVDMQHAIRRKTTSGMRKLFPRARKNEASNFPEPSNSESFMPLGSSSSQCFGDGNFCMQNNPMQMRSYGNGLNNASKQQSGQREQNLGIMMSSNSNHNSQAQHIVQTSNSKRSSFCAMLASLEEQFQDQRFGDPNNAENVPQLFTQPAFTSRMKELAHELQSSTLGFLDGNGNNGAESRPLAGLELLNLTAARRRSSLTELYSAAVQRRESMNDLLNVMALSSNSSGKGGKMQQILGKKRSRQEAENESASSTLGAAFRPSIISALSLLNRDNSNNSSSNRFPYEWMDEYYLDDAMRDLDDSRGGNECSKNEIKSSKLRASVYVLLSVLSTADGEIVAASGGNSATEMSPFDSPPFAPQDNRQNTTPPWECRNQLKRDEQKNEISGA